MPGPMSNFGLTRSQSTSGVSQVKYVIRRLGAIFTAKVCGIVLMANKGSEWFTECLCIPLTNHISLFSTQVILTLLHLKIGPIYPGGSGELYKRSSCIRCSSLFHPFPKIFSKIFFALLPKGKSVLFQDWWFHNKCENSGCEKKTRIWRYMKSHLRHCSMHTLL